MDVEEATLDVLKFDDGSYQWMDSSAPSSLTSKIWQLQWLLLEMASQQQQQAVELVDQFLLLAESNFASSSLQAPELSSHAVDASADLNTKTDLVFQMFSAEEQELHVSSSQELQSQTNLSDESQPFELVELDAVEILAEYTHFCETCGKGFKRDANLRMHMRAHGDEYKNLAALTRPVEDLQQRRRRWRYSCPFEGCRRNKLHLAFLPLKTLLCVKNHYRRSHCPKLFNCTKCNSKSFSIVADLRTHEKHCGQGRWRCSCGNFFTRKDKLASHIAIFSGHTAAPPQAPPPPKFETEEYALESYDLDQLPPQSDG